MTQDDAAKSAPTSGSLSASTFSDVSLGPLGMGFACAVSVDGSLVTRRYGRLHGVSNSREGELMAIAKALEIVPADTTATVYSDLEGIDNIMRDLSTPAAVLVSWVIQERSIAATFRYIGRRHSRPRLYQQCHRASRRAAQGRPLGKGWVL